jgi:cyclohexyl-isocyanide hydratase
LAQDSQLPDFTIGILLYRNCDLLDIAGPNDAFDFFDASVIGRNSRVVTFAATTRPLPGVGALKVSAGYDYESCPPLDLLFVPGGGADGLKKAIADDRLLGIIAERARTARYVASVCTGGLLLAAAGLLDGREATTHWAVVDCLKLFPGVKVVNGCPRYVLDGNVFTGGGISSSIDLSLYMIETIVRENFVGKDPAEAEAAAKAAAQRVQLSIQYNPRPPWPGGDPCSVDYAVYAPTAAGMKDFHDPVCAAVADRILRMECEGKA